MEQCQHVPWGQQGVRNRGELGCAAADRRPQLSCSGGIGLAIIAGLHDYCLRSMQQARMNHI